MKVTTEAEWPDEFTREEMIEQQSRLLIEECHLLQKEVRRYQKNIAKLVDINTEVTVERDKLRAELAAAKAVISQLNADSYEQSREIHSLKMIKDQRDAVLREHKVPGYYYDPDIPG